MKIDTTFARKEATASGVIEMEYCINARLLNDTTGYRAVALSPTTLKPSPVVFRRRMSDPGRGVLTTFQRHAGLVVICAWDGTHIRFFIDSDGCQRQVYDDYRDDHRLLAAVFKENPWLKAWLMAGPGATDHYLPAEVAPESGDTGVYLNDLSYAKFCRMYPGIDKHINHQEWRNTPRDKRHLGAVDTTVLEAEKISRIALRHGAVILDIPEAGDKAFVCNDCIRVLRVV